MVKAKRHSAPVMGLFLLSAFAISLLIASEAFAGVSRVNPGFETGNLTGWNTSGSISVQSSWSGYTAPYGNKFALLSSAGCSGANLSQNFTGLAGEVISGQAAFKTGDYLPYNDYGQLRILQGNVVIFYKNVAAVGNFGQTPWTAWSYTLPADGAYTIEGTAKNAGDCGVNSYLLLDSQHNTAPVADANGPYIVAIGNDVLFDGSGSSDIDNNSLTEVWTADGGTVSGNTYTADLVPGIYQVTLVVNDSMTDSNPDTTTVVVYDPSGGFVTGGGWIDSPVDAFKADETLTGKASFGFVSKYKKGALVPTGNTEFQFKAGDLNFHSTSYDWLIVNQNDENAQYKGEGTINGTGTYNFMLWAGDNTDDTFRIQITEVGGGIIYDNGLDQTIGGGQIVIHSNK